MTSNVLVLSRHLDLDQDSSRLNDLLSPEFEVGKIYRDYSLNDRI